MASQNSQPTKMTSLCPGTLFSFSGLNRKSTPTPPQITAEELSKRYKRESFNGRPWPNASPTAGVYDIGFTSTKLILLNYQRKKECKLRGRNDPAMDADIFPNPGRHSRSSTPNQKEKHKKCYDSSSPYYKAPRVGNLDWINYEMTAEERFKFEDGSMVNPRHHTSCLVSSDPNAFRMGMMYSGKRPSSPTSLPPNFRSSPMLTHKDLNKGEKQYLYSIAKIYSASQMMKLKQEQYNQLLAREMEKGLYTEDEYQQYLRYIQMGRKRQYLRSQGRAVSAPLMRMFDNADNRRPGLYPSSVREDTESQTMSQRETSASDKPSRPASKKSTRSLRPTVPARTSISSDFTPSKKETSDQSKSKPDSAHQKKEKEDSTNQTKESSQKSGDKEESSDTSESTPWDPNRKNVHKEGVDRPRSRIGHIPEDAKSSKSFESSEQDTTSREDTTTTKQSKEEEQQKNEEQIKEEQQKHQMKEEQQIKEEQRKQQIREELQKQQIKEEQQKQIKEEQQKQQIKEEQQFTEQEEKQNEEEGKSEEEKPEEEPSKQNEDAEEAAVDRKSIPEEDKNEDKEDEARASPGSMKDDKTQKEKSSSESEHGVAQGSQQRRDSSSSYEIDEVSKVNKDPDKLEY